MWVLEQKLTFLFDCHLALQDLVPESRIELACMFREHLLVSLLVLQVLCLACLQLLLALLGLGNKSVAELRVFETTFLLLIKVRKEEVNLLIVAVDAHLVAQRIS